MTNGQFDLFDVAGVKRFEDTQYYKDMMANCTVVTVAPTAYFWAGEIVDVFGVPALVGKMPQRIWVGLEPKAESGIEYGTYKHYDPATHVFKDVNVQETTRRESIAYLNEWVNQQERLSMIHSSGPRQGYRMHQYAETLYGRSHVSPKLSGGRAVAEAAAVLAAFMGLSDAGLHPWRSGDYLKIPCKDALINELCYLSWELAAIGYGGYHGASDVANALMDSSYPILCHSAAVLKVPSRDEEPVPHKVRGLTFEAKTLTNFGLPSGTPFWSLDVAVIFSGLNKRTLAALDVARTLRDMNTVDWQVRDWYPHTLRHKMNPSDVALKAGEMLVLECLNKLFWSLRSPYSKELVGGLTKITNQYRSYMGMLGLASITMDRLMTYLEETTSRILGQAGFPTAGIKPTNEGIGGGVLLIAPATGIRRELPQTIETARRLTPEGLDVRIEYASWEHGFLSSGIRILKSKQGGVVRRTGTSSTVSIEATPEATLSEKANGQSQPLWHERVNIPIAPRYRIYKKDDYPPNFRHWTVGSEDEVRGELRKAGEEYLVICPYWEQAWFHGIRLDMPRAALYFLYSVAVNGEFISYDEIERLATRAPEISSTSAPKIKSSALGKLKNYSATGTAENEYQQRAQRCAQQLAELLDDALGRGQGGVYKQKRELKILAFEAIEESAGQ